MINSAVNDDKTIAGGEGAILVGRYRILCQLGRGGTEAAMCDVKMV